MRGATGLLAALGLVAGAAAEPCRVEASLASERAFVGQQVLYSARVLMADGVDSIQWTAPVAFPHTRTEALPGEPLGGRVEVEGRTYHVRDERWAVFPERPGSLRLEAPALRCRSADGETRVAVPPLELAVVDPPESGRPEGWTGLIGPVVPHRTLTPREVRLGESVRLALMVRGPGNLWAMDPPLPREIEGAELFVRRPELALERGRRLALRRHFVYDVVPRSEGTLHLPALAIPYFDPEREAYAVAALEPARVAVLPRATAPPSAAAPPRGAPTESGRAAEGSGTPRPLVWLAVVGAVSLGGLAAGWVRRRRRPASRVPEPGEGPVAQGRALRAALERHLSGAASATSEELMARPGLSPAVESALLCLAAVERARFDPQASAPDAAEVRRAIAAL